MQFGDLTLTPLWDGTFRLDGGAMFGVVPKPLWEKRAPADEKNRIRLGLRPLLVQSARRPSSSTPASAARWTRRASRSSPSTDRATSITRSPTPASAATRSTSSSPRTCTSTTPAASRRATQQGSLVPAFPRARYVVRTAEWDDAAHPHERNRASYLTENFVPLADAGVLDLVAGDDVDHAGRPRRADRRSHEASSDRRHRVAGARRPCSRRT